LARPPGPSLVGKNRTAEAERRDHRRHLRQTAAGLPSRDALARREARAGKTGPPNESSPEDRRVDIPLARAAAVGADLEPWPRPHPRTRLRGTAGPTPIRIWRTMTLPGAERAGVRRGIRRALAQGPPAVDLPGRGGPARGTDQCVRHNSSQLPDRWSRPCTGGSRSGRSVYRRTDGARRAKPKCKVSSCRRLRRLGLNRVCARHGRPQRAGRRRIRSGMRGAARGQVGCSRGWCGSRHIG